MRDARELLRRFVQGPDRSLGAARELEGALATQFPEDERLEDLLLALASYRPGGGELLYDEKAILPFCKAALDLLT
jgi:hypothetical protein